VTNDHKHFFPKEFMKNKKNQETSLQKIDPKKFAKGDDSPVPQMLERIIENEGLDEINHIAEFEDEDQPM
jgi:hypothetical protein